MKYFITTILFILTLLLFSTTIYGSDYYWNGGTGDWDVGSNWVDVTGTISYTNPPEENDNAIIMKDPLYNIAQGDIITIPPGNYEFKSLNISGWTTLTNRPKLNFTGSMATDTVHFNINRDITLSKYFIIQYLEPRYNRWVLDGSNNHIVTSDGVDMNYLIIDTLNIKTTFNLALKASEKIHLKEGELYGSGIVVRTKQFVIKTAHSDTDHFKNLHLINKSTIICRVFSAAFNYETDSYFGNFLVDCHLFRGGNESDFGEVNVYLRDSVLSTYQYNFSGNGITINNLTIDSDTKTEIAGQITVNDFTLLQPNSEIVFNLKSTFQPDDSRKYTFVINGIASIPAPPSGSCPELTNFYTKLGSFKKMEFLKNSGTLTFDGVRMKGIGTSGAATFNVTNGIVEDYASDWDNITGVPSVDYFWVNGTGDWDDPNHWATSSGGAGNGICVPTLFDDVYFDNSSFSGGEKTVTINAAMINECRHLKWAAQISNKIEFSTGSAISKPELNVAGDLLLKWGMTVSDLSGYGKIILVGTGDFVVDAPNIDLPYLVFRNASGTWTLARHTNCVSIELAGGTLNTGDKDINLSKIWAASAGKPKFFELTSSTITASNKIDFGIFSNNATVDAGTSYLRTKRFVAEDGDYHILHMENTHDTVFSYREHTFHKLILDSPHNLKTRDSLTVDSLIFMQDGGSLELDIDFGIVVKEGIRSSAPGVTKPKIFSDNSGSQADFKFLPDNLCIQGPIAIKDMNAVGAGLVRIPGGVDEGNNTNIDFTPTPAYEGVLYWIGGQGGWSDKENWSTGSGSCPADLFPSGADSLIFDNYSTTLGDTVFLPTNETANTLVMRNNDQANTTLFYLGQNLKLLHSLIINGGNFEVVDDTNTGVAASIWVDKEVSLSNGANLTLDNATIYACRKPSLSTETTFYMDGTSSLNGTNSTIAIMGHSSQPGQKTIDIDQNATGDMSDINFEITKATNGQNDYHMDFYFGGHVIKDLILNNYTPFLQNGDIQEYKIFEDVLTKNTTINYGKVIVKKGSTLYTYN